MLILDDFKLNGRCSKCPSRVTDTTVQWSKKKFGTIYCYQHIPESYYIDKLKRAPYLTGKS